jgi:signal transduction histidine kinase
MQDELQEYLSLLFKPENPVYFSILLVLILFLLFIFIYKYVISPLREKHLVEKKELELKNIKLMALFAELDPNPLIRVDEKGKIIHNNDAAKALSKNTNLEGKNIKDILTTINFSIKDYIKNDKSIIISETINNRYYSILLRGISYLNIAQIYFDDLTDRKMFEEELQLSKTKLRELSVHLRDTLEDERQRIARELHDSIGQNLNLIRVKLLNNGLIQDNVTAADKETLLNALESSIDELKEITYNLKPKILDEWGLGASLKVLIKKISENTGISGTVDITGDEKRLDKKLELTLYRLVQEIINNIIKHSGAKEFNIQLICRKDFVKLLVSDDGVGFDTNKIISRKHTSGFGLLNMQERVQTYNGRLKIDSSPGNGTIIIVEIPGNG